ncbi:MAG TPA: hypothetical protein VNM90_05050 [Haliangium sp.]|nr:hypothetical protein [Haliangium sp.]
MTSPSEPDTRPVRRRAGWILAAALVLAALSLVSWLRSRQQDHAPGADPGQPPSPGAPASPPGSGPPRPTRPSGPPPGPMPGLPAGAADLHASLGEEAVPVASDVVIEAIDADRASVCAGESPGTGGGVDLAARVSGLEPGAVQRWIWRRDDGAVELQPGGAIAWSAPSTPGWYRVHFQVCTDLGGRRIGVLAERSIDVEVRACAPGEASAALRIAVSQRGHGAFAFSAVVADQAAGEAPVTGYRWDFGDGAQAETTAPNVEHAYSVASLGARDEARFPVRLTARRAGAAPLVASASVLVRGFPDPRTEGPVALEIGRWRLDPATKGWQSPIAVRPREQPITWDRLERITKYADDRVDMATLDWRDVIAVDESLPHGGFRGRVLVPAEQAPADVKQIIDVLYGHTSDGTEVTVSWTPFKRPAVEGPGRDVAAPGK